MAKAKSPKPSPPPRPGALNTIGRVREELGKVYRDARVGAIKTSDATKLAYCLNLMREFLMEEELEGRIVAVEKAVEKAMGNST